MHIGTVTLQDQIPLSQTVLAIDTAGPRLQLALFGGAQTDVLVEDLPKGHAEIIFARIDELLTRNGKTYQDLTRIAVTTGPGSFTGLRIGLSAARGIGLGLGVPVIGVPTLLALSLAITQTGPFEIIVDARRGEAYAQKFNAPAAPSSSARILPFDGKTTSSQFMPQKVDIATLAKFAATTNPADFLPIPAYLRDADAKPQTKGIVAHQGSPK